LANSLAHQSNPLILAGMQVMFIAGALVLLALGILILATGKLIVRGK